MKFFAVVALALVSAALADVSNYEEVHEGNAEFVDLAEFIKQDELSDLFEGDGGHGTRYVSRPGGNGGWGGWRGPQPNIILVVADDLGSNDVGWNGSPDIKTPNLDALAHEGVILNNYYTQPVCTPSRVQLLSGVHEVAAGLCHEVIHSGQRNALPNSLPTLPDKLKELGYATHLVGKWNLGHWEKEFLPTNRGFDTFYGFVNALTDHFTHSAYERFINSTGQLVTFNGHDLWENEQQTSDGANVHTTQLFTERFQKLFRDHISGHNRNQPFFLDLSFGAPHYPLEVPDQYLAQYDNIIDINRKTYAGMVSAVDEAVGTIVSTLKSDKKFWENTIFVFTNDNGAVPFFGGNNFPLRGRKQTWWEGGNKGVAFVNSPLIEQRYRGRKSEAWLHISDFYPTFVALARGSTSSQKLNGFNVWNSINGFAPSPRVELLHGIDVVVAPYGTSRPNSAFDTRLNAAIRVGNYKLLTGDPVDSNWYASPFVANISQPRIGPQPPRDQVLGQSQMEAGYIIRKNTDPVGKNFWLFDILRDPTETTDLSADLPWVVDALLARLAYYQENVMVQCNFPHMDMLADPTNFNGNFFPWAENNLPPPIF